MHRDQAIHLQPTVRFVGILTGMALSRRDFIKTATAAATAGAISAPAAQTDAKDGLPTRVLGKTSAAVTILGLGCAWIAKTTANQPTPEAHTRTIIDAAMEGGIRYFDTAPNYVLSEERLGRALARERDRVFLATKLDHGDAASAEQDLASSLKLLRTDHVDLLLLHGLGLPEFADLARLQRKDGALTVLRRAKDKGLARFIGFSSHPTDLPRQRQFAMTTGMDVIMPWINYISRAQFNAEELLVEPSLRQKIGVVAMKVLGGEGQLADNYDLAFGYALSAPGVQCALIGASTPQQVKRAMQAARDFRPLTESEMKRAIELGRKLFESKSNKSALLHRHRGVDFASAALA